MSVYPIPDAALDDRLGFVGTAGSGKTYNAGSGVERVLARGARVVIPDPLGVWWGLGFNADASGPSPWRDKSRLFVFGGEHGDFPISEHHGAVIGETVAGMAESVILDLSGFGVKAAERRFMLAFLTAFYRKANGDPVHLVFDEADMWAPQTVRDKDGEANKLLGMMETVVRRGRVRGFIPWLITQRPAVLNKDVLSQVDGLVAFKLTASQDRKAIGDWVSGQADQGAWPAISASLPTLPTGTGVVWLPARGVLATEAFPPKLTFDSSRTPKRGEKRQRRDLKPLDLGKLKDRLATVEEEAKANDPRALKAEIATLKRDLAKATSIRDAHAPVPQWPDQRELVAQLTAEVSQLRQWSEWAGRAEGALSVIENELRKLNASPAEASRVSIPTVPTPQRRAAPAAPLAARQPSPAREVRQSEAGSGSSIPARPTLAELVRIYPAGMTRGQLAAAVGIKKSGSTLSSYLSKLRTAGLIDEREGRIFASEAGALAIGPIDGPPPEGPERARWWSGKVGCGPVVEYLISAWPEWSDRAVMGEELGINPTGSTLSSYISKLSTAGVVDKDGALLRLSAEVMG